MASNNQKRRRKARGARIAALCAAGTGVTGAAAAAPPTLPTPCTSCTNPFLQSGKAGAAVSGNTMTVTQTTNQAILNWANFNIGTGYTVNFVQPSSTSATLNKIGGANPSVIAGQLNANGQIYLYNQNGIVFSNGAQVNVGALTASTLKLSDQLFTNGILSGNTGLSSGQQVPAVFQADTSTGVPSGTVTVNAGATLNAADRGSIILLGTAVTNQGKINTPDGQTILGAGNTVYLAASTDPSLRGLLIEVDAGSVAGSTQTPQGVTNTGQITADRGNITLAGMVVNQAGQLTATTSVSSNGSIYLVAGDTSGTGNFYNALPKDSSGNATAFGALLPNTGGTLTLAPGSVTEVLPDPTDTATITSAQSFIPSQVDLVGKTITLQGNATIHAPGGAVSLQAAADPYNEITSLNSKSPTTDQSNSDGSRIYLDTGSTIDVSGLTAVPVAVTQNIIQVSLEGNDLQDDPLLRSGLLHGLTVTVDVDKGSSLFDITPYLANIGRGIDQVLTNAGTINLHSDGDVIARAGSTLNVSGGSVAFQGATAPSTTKLLGANGLVYDISNAPNDIQYVGLANSYSYTDPTWGTKTSASANTYYAGYTQGANAGSVAVTGRSIYLGGTMLAATVAGPYQRVPGTLPQGGSLLIGCNCLGALTGGRDYDAPAVVVMDGALADLGAFNATTSLPPGLDSLTALAPTQLEQGGFNNLSIYSNGAVNLPVGSNLRLAPGGSLAVQSLQSVEIDGSIQAPGATVTLGTAATSLSGDSSPHDVTLGANAVIDVSGGWTNDSPTVTQFAGTAPVVVNGGNVTLSAAGSVLLGSGSLINVSGGGWMNSSNVLTAGSGGSIALEANYSTAPSGALPSYSGSLEIGSGATLLGASLAAGKGGDLTLQSGSVTVGPDYSGTPGELLLQPQFFTQGGFTSYSIIGQNDVIIGSENGQSQAQVVVAPLQQTLVFTQNSLSKPTGSNLADFTQLAVLPAAQRQPASISFTANANSNGAVAETGDVLLAQNASIVTDPGATVALQAAGNTGNLSVLGDIIAPAGTIDLQVGSSTAIQSEKDNEYLPNQQLLLGPNALLSATASAQIDTLDPQGYREGSVLQGGTISLLAYRGSVVTQAGSNIDVSGAAGTIDVVNSKGVTATTVVGNAGAIDIEAREGLVLQGSLHGQAAPVAGAGGGSVTVGLDLYDYGTQAGNDASTGATPLARTLTVSGQPAAALSNVLQRGVGQVSAGLLDSGGFDSITVKSSDILAIDGNVSLSAKAGVTLDAPILVGNAGANATLSAAHVSLGNYFNQADYFNTTNPKLALFSAPLAGSAVLNVNTQELDIRGESAWSGFATANLSSSADIRLGAPLNVPSNLVGAPSGQNSNSNNILQAGLSTTADLTFTAAQIYPTTDTPFTINTSGKVTIAPAVASSMTPLSAGGSLTINAATIDQEGVIRAPLGQITLNGSDTVNLAKGSVTSVSANGLDIPFGSTSNGLQWTYTVGTGGGQVTQVFDTPPAKDISINGPGVSIDSGATVDLSGGGDLYAYEWIKGPGGSKDVLDPTSGIYKYAILPSLGSSFSPLDTQYQAGSAATGNQTIYLSGVPGLAAGYYALLPARYALLPGAYAISVVKSNSDIASGSSVRQPDGSYIVAGKMGVSGTDVVDSRTSTVLVVSDTIVRTESQYNDTSANVFFSSQAATNLTAAPRLPADAGELQLSGTNMTLGGTIDFAPGSFVSGTDANGKPITQQGLGGIASILASDIVVSDAPATGAGSPGVLQLDAQSLDNLHAQTLILGAIASTTTTGEELSVSSTQTVELQNSSVALTAPEIILAAQQNILIDDGAQLHATGGLSQSPQALVVNGAGAVLRASSGAQSTLSVLSSPAGGTVSIGANANVAADGSLLLYSSQNMTVGSNTAIVAPAVAVYSTHVSVGDAPANSSGGLDLTAQLLASLGSKLTDLTIGSSSTIDFYGNVGIGTPGSGSQGLQSITLDAQALGGYGAGAANADVTLQAGAITLTNSSGSAATAAELAGTGGSGTLTLVANASSAQKGSGQITLGAGDKTISGFGAVVLQADEDIQGQGTGSLTVATTGLDVPVTLQSARLTTASGATQTISTSGAVNIVATAAPASITQPALGLGGSLTIQGGSINQSGVIDLPAGIITLQAMSGDVTLGQGSVTSAAGVDKNYTVTDVVAAAGTINLQSSTGNVTLASGATVDVAGASSSDGKVNGDAGTLSVSAPGGQFAFNGAILEGSAAAGQAQGNFTLDVGSGLVGNGLGSLTAALASGGFDGAISLRTRGDSSVALANGSTVKATSFDLSADVGSVDIAGTIDTSGTSGLYNQGGAISLWAGNGLTLESSARLLANGGAAGPEGANGAPQAAQAGNVTLGTTNGYVNFVSTGVNQNPIISMMGGGAAATDGTLTIRAPRTSDDLGVQITSGGLEADTRKPVVVEGYKAYWATDLGASDVGTTLGITANSANVLFSDAQTFVTSLTGADAAMLLGLTKGTSGNGQMTAQVRAGVEVDSTGDLTLDSGNTWDLDSWAQALGAPINLTLRAAGNLVFNSSLSDGFTSTGAAVTSWKLGESATATLVDSASYTLVAGADITQSGRSADPLAVLPVSIPSSGVPPSTGNVVITPGSLIRTGDGNINIAAGGDVLLGYTPSVDASGNVTYTGFAPLSSDIYTAGIPAAALDPTLFVPPTVSRSAPAPVYPTNGGAISVSAVDDIRSAPSTQLVSDWMWRNGSTNTDGTLVSPALNTSWWILFSNFQQGIGALGGGNLSLTAGRDIVDVAAVIPTTGRLKGAAGSVADVADLVVTGGGNLSVRAGRNIASGTFEADWGNASLTAGGAVTSGVTVADVITDTNTQNGNGATPLYPLLLTGNGIFDVNGRTGVTIDAVSNSTALPLTVSNFMKSTGSQAAAYFYTYAPDADPSTLNLLSTGGDVVLNSDTGALPVVLLIGATPARYESYNTTALEFYPATFNAASLSGNIDLNNAGISLFPAASGNLNLLASGSILSSSPTISVNVSGFDPSQEPNAALPAGGGTPPNPAAGTLPQQLLHVADAQPIFVVANSGDISPVQLIFPKAAQVIAGGNISDLTYSGENINSGDVTLIEAGGNITYTTPRVAGTDAVSANPAGITLGGTGYLEVLAGGNIDLGASTGVVTTGNFSDTRLPATGATMVVGAGFGSSSNGSIRQPDETTFINTYLAPDKNGAASAYAPQLISFMDGLQASGSPTLSYSAALTGFEALNSAQRLPLLAQVLTDELSATGLAHNNQGTSYDRGYAAINTLFPTKDPQGNALAYQGDIDLFFSQLKTEGGGDIDLLAPGGSVVAGVANPPATLDTIKAVPVGTTGTVIPGEGELGVLVLEQGAIQGFADQDFTVNTSRMLTLQGGDIILWASNGNIDAGKGAKTASAAPPPVIQIDNSGNVFINPLGAVSGSGIGQLLTVPGITPGLVNLIAPKGAVDAGDAGIRVAGNLNIAAVTVIGASNITVGGTATGVPVSEAGALSGALSGANSLGDAGKAAVEQLSSNLGAAANFQQLTDSLQPAFIVVKMFCLGVECETH